MSDLTTTVTNVLVPIATAQLGPLGGLVVQLGLPAALAAIAKHRQKASVAGLTDAEIQQAAGELLSGPTFEQAVKAGQQDDDGD